MSYRIIDEDDTVIAVDANDIEICGARQPQGHDYWKIYSTLRLTDHNHYVIASSKEAATWHVDMLASLYTQAAHPLQEVWSPADARQLAARAAQLDGVDISGARAYIGDEERYA